LAKRESNITSPRTIEIIIIPDAERVEQAAKIAAPAYRRELLKQIRKKEEELPPLVKLRESPEPPPAA